MKYSARKLLDPPRFFWKGGFLSVSIIYDLKAVLTRLKKVFATKTNATQSAAGLMSADDKKKLDSIDNTADADKAVKSAAKIESTYDGTSGYQELMTWTGSKGTDYAYIRCGMTASDEGYLELSTADNGDSPIYVKQYGVGGVSQTANARVATLLDKSGNTIFPGTVTASSFIGKATSADNDGNGNNIVNTYAVKPKVKSLTIPTTNWKAITTAGDYKYYYDLSVANLTADDVVTINLSPSSQTVAITCGLCATNESFSGKIRLYAKSVPTASMSGDFYILKCVRE